MGIWVDSVSRLLSIVMLWTLRCTYHFELVFSRYMPRSGFAGVVSDSYIEQSVRQGILLTHPSPSISNCSHRAPPCGQTVLCHHRFSPWPAPSPASFHQVIMPCLCSGLLSGPHLTQKNCICAANGLHDSQIWNPAASSWHSASNSSLLAVPHIY